MKEAGRSKVSWLVTVSVGSIFRWSPLSRVTLFRTEDTEHTLVWTFHHILADGHSYPALLREVFARYEALRDGKELTLPAPRPYREYIRWLEVHFAEMRIRSEKFWRDTLRGFQIGTPLPNLAAGASEKTGVAEKSVASLDGEHCGAGRLRSHT